MKHCQRCGKELAADAAFCPGCGAPVEQEGQSVGDGAAGSFRKTEIKSDHAYGAADLENLPEGVVLDDRYEIKEKVGHGGFGAVYRAYDRKMDIDKALKVLPRSVAEDKRSLERLLAEARTMAKLNHPQIVRLYEINDRSSIKFLDMEYVGGGNLADRLFESEKQRLAEEEVRQLAQQIAEGLAYAHEQGVIHKDIKPQNILISEDTGAKIMDFGISETVRTSLSRLSNTTSSGTLVYMSPEQIRGKDVGKEADIYSFGAMLYELLCGHPPFYKGDIHYQILNESPEPIAGVSDQMNAFLQKCLAKDYQGRYRSFAEVGAALKGKKIQPAARTISASASGTRSGRWRKTLGAATGVVVLIAAIALLLMFWQKQEIKQANQPVRKKITEPASSAEKSSPPAGFGSLYVRTEPAGAEVLVDGQSQGPSPVELKKIEAGSHTLAARQKYYQEANEEIAIEKDVVTKKNLILPPGIGRITVFSTPTEAQVWLDEEKAAGKTPLTIEEVPAGKHQLRLSQGDYYAAGAEAEVLPGRTARQDISLKQCGRLYINTTPDKAEIVLPDIQPAYQPGLRLEPGQYTVQAAAEGYHQKEETFRITAGKDTRLSLELKQITGRLYVETEPSDATVKIMNIPERFSPGMELSPGRYQVRAEKSGYLPAEKWVTLAAGQTERIKLELGPPLKFTNSLGMDFVYIKPGTFMMGSPASESGRDDDERRHRVTLSRGFYMQTTEVTIGQYRRFLQATHKEDGVDWDDDDCPIRRNSSYSLSGNRFGQSNDQPMVEVSWHGARAFAKWLSRKTGKAYRLPTEAEWEYACRAGSTTRYSWGNNASCEKMMYENDVGSDEDNCVSYYKRRGLAADATAPVASFSANAWGLYDMHGNVWEWCSDWFGDYPSGSVTDPTGPSSGACRVLRGGSWNYFAGSCRSAIRYRDYPSSRNYDGGFRLVLLPGQ